MCTHLYLTLETHAGTLHTSMHPLIPPQSYFTLWQPKAGQGHLKVQEMQHDSTTLTYACVTVEQIDD